MNALFQTILNMSVAGGVIILAVLLARLVLRRAPKWTRLVLWAIVGLRLALPFFVESPLSLMPRSAEVDLSAVEAELASKSAPAATDAPIATFIPRLTESPALTQTPAVTQSPALTQSPVVTQSPAETREPSVLPAGTVADEPAHTDPLVTFNWVSFASFVWAAGAVIMIAYALISWAVLRRRLSTAVRLEGNVYEADSVKTPFLLGILKPKIYLPFGMDARSRELVLKHEMSHIEGFDHVIKPLGWLILSAHWFNPLAWLAFALFSKDVELACDERVVRKLDDEGRADYGETLLNLSVNKRRIAACPLAFGESNAKERVKNVLSYKKPALWIIIAAVLAAAAVAVCLLTNPKKKTDREFVTVTKGFELAAENGWVAVDENGGFVTGEEVWNEFCRKVNAKEDAEVTLVMPRDYPIEKGKYKDAEETFDSYSALFRKLSFNGRRYVLRESFVYPFDFETRKTYPILGSFDDNDGLHYYLSDKELSFERKDGVTVLSGDALVFFTAKPAGFIWPVQNEPYAYAEEHGWVAVDPDHSFRCGREKWREFLEKTAANEPAEVTVVRTEKMKILLDSDPKGIEYSVVTAARIVFDGEKYIASESVGNAESFGEEREFTYLEGHVGGNGEGDIFMRYTLSRKPLEELQSKDAVGGTPLYEEEILNLFSVRAAEIKMLSEFPEEEILGIFAEWDITVPEQFIANSYLKGLVSECEQNPNYSPYADWYVPFFFQYDVKYGVDLYYGRIPVPEKPVLSHLGHDGCKEALAKFGANIPDEGHNSDPRYLVMTLERDINVLNPFVFGEEGYELFEQIRTAAAAYYGLTTEDPLAEYAQWGYHPTADSRIAQWMIDLDGDSLNEVFCVDLDLLVYDSFSFAWVTASRYGLVGDMIPCGTGHTGYTTFAVVEGPEYGTCIMRLAAEWGGQFYGFDLLKIVDGEFKKVYSEVLWQYDPDDPIPWDEERAKDYENRVNALLETGYLLITTDRLGVMQGDLTFLHGSDYYTMTSDRLAIVCGYGSSGTGIERMREDAEGGSKLLFMDEKLMYRLNVVKYEEPGDDPIVELVPDTPLSIDVDGDGAADSLVLNKNGSRGAALSVKLSSGSGENISKYVPVLGDCLAAVVDLDPDNAGRTIVFSWITGEGEFETQALRVNGVKNGFDVFSAPIRVGKEILDEGYRFDPYRGLPCGRHTEIFGPYTVYGYFTVNGEGIEFTDEFRYGTTFLNGYLKRVKLKRELDVLVRGENGSMTVPYTVFPGEWAAPVYTDAETYVVVRLDDGRLAYIGVTLEDGGLTVLFNGIEQHEYSDGIRRRSFQ